jgi:hypothetical protein
MRKKADFSIAEAILLVIVVFVVAVIAWSTLVAKESPTRWLLNAAERTAGIYQGSADFDKLQERVNSLMECKGQAEYENVKRDIEAQIVKTSKEEQGEMLDKLTKLRADAEANYNLCGASSAFNSAVFDGVNANFLDAARAAFVSAQGASPGPGSVAYIQAQEKIDLIDKILKCNFEADRCKPANTKNFCVWFDGKCKKAICSEAKSSEEYCRVIEEQAGLCYRYKIYQGTSLPLSPAIPSNMVLVYQLCKPCVEVSTCKDYGYNENACNDFCKKGLNCQYFENALGKVGPCLDSGHGILEVCYTYTDKTQCLNQNLPSPAPPACFWQEGYNPSCRDCTNINKCEDYGEITIPAGLAGVPLKWQDCTGDICQKNLKCYADKSASKISCKTIP